jgi:hypothetical protein
MLSSSAKQKFKFRLSRGSTEDKDRLKRACDTAVSALATTLEIVKEASGDTGVPGLKSGITGLLFIIQAAKVRYFAFCLSNLLTMLQKMSRNTEDVEELLQRIESLETLFQTSKDRGTLSPAVLDRIDHLCLYVLYHTFSTSSLLTFP